MKDSGHKDWARILEPLIKKYENHAHPLRFHNTYQLLVMVVLAAQTSDNAVNKIAPRLFERFPTLQDFAAASTKELISYLSSIRNHRTKISWLLDLANSLGHEDNIPLTMEGLVAHKGIGRKSANVILRETGQDPAGIVVDLHVIRVAGRMGLSSATTGDKVEKDLMRRLPQKIWNTAGMAMSFLGRDTCRPSNPSHEECPVASNCEFCMAKFGNG